MGRKSCSVIIQFVFFDNSLSPEGVKDVSRVRNMFRDVVGAAGC